MKGNRRNNPPPPAAAAAAAATTTNGATAALPSPTSPSSKGTAKYTNKDGSKFITVPKVASPVTTGSPAPPFSPTRPQAADNDMSASTAADAAAAAAPTGNRKKAKRRAKAAAREKKAEEETSAATAPPHRQGQNGVYNIQLGDNLSHAVAKHHQNSNSSHEATAVDSGDEHAHPNGPAISGQPQEDAASNSKKSKKKKKKKGNTAGSNDAAAPAANNVHSAPHAQQQAPAQTASGPVKGKIWNTNSQEERQRIKEFWLDLSEDERKSLVKVEKDTVLKKMKEQQKMTCSCHFCGRKRTAIEEELEGLYDSYYEELEQFANDPAGQQHQQQQRASGLLPSSASAGRFGGPHGHHGHDAHSRALAHSYAQQRYSQSHPGSAPGGSHQPSRGRIVGHAGEDDEEDDEELDEEYVDDEDEEDDEDDDDEVDDDEEDVSDDDGEEEEDIPPEETHRDYANDFFNFGNSLQVHGGILTVADDLLKNDGRKFIEMMEQLAERRMAREEDAKDQYGGPGGRGYPGAPGMNGAPYGHNHHIPSEEEDYGPEDEDEEDYGSEDDEYDQEEDTMTEEQRMEEGRRMFQIFAARMFEQRVLTAYREKVSKERQQRLIDEIDEEKDRQQRRDEKRAKDAQKRKDKVAQKKKALADEKARKDAEKLAEQEARRAETAQREEELKRKAEEKRKKKEAQRKAEEEQRLRKEAERQLRINEQRNQEQRAREAKERDKRLKEEARQREKEEQEKRERESRERKEKQERDKRDKEARARANEAKERQRQEERAAQKAAPAAARAAVPVPAVPAVPVPAVPAVPATTAAPGPVTLPKRPAQAQPAQQPPAIPALPQQLPQASPQPAVATPAALQQKTPTPMRPRQQSQQGAANSAASVAGSSSRAVSLSGSGPSQSQNQSQTASPNPMTPAQSSTSFGSSVNKASIGLLGGIFSHGSSAAPGGPSFFQPTSPLSGVARPVSQQQQPFMVGGGNGAPGSPSVLPFQLGSPPPVSMPPGFGQAGGPLAFRSVTGPPGMMPILSSSSSSSSAMNSIGRGNNGFGPMVPPPGFGGLAGIGPGDALVTPIGSLPHDGSGMGGGQHSRQASGGGFDPGSSLNGNGLVGGSGLASMPIGRPAPIGRPGSTVHGQRPGVIGSPSVGSSALGQDSNGADDEFLGSRALLDDSEFPMDGYSSIRRSVFSGHGAGAGGGTAPPAHDMSSPFMSPSSLWAPPPVQHHHQSPLHHAPGLHQHLGQLSHPMSLGGNAFPPPQSAFGPPPGMAAPPGMGTPSMAPPGLAAPGWGMAMQGGVANGNAGGSVPLTFASPGASLGRTTQGRSVTLRQLLCRACKELAVDLEAAADGADGNDDSAAPRMVPIDAVKTRVAALADACFVGPVQDGELDQLYDTEGNSKNGGGNFDVKRADADSASLSDNGPVTAIRWVPDAQALQQRFTSGNPAGGSNGDAGFGNPFGGSLGGIGGIGGLGGIGGGIGGSNGHGFGGFGGFSGLGGISSGLSGIGNGMGSMGGFGGLANNFGASDGHSSRAPIGAALSSTTQR